MTDCYFCESPGLLKCPRCDKHVCVECSAKLDDRDGGRGMRCKECGLRYFDNEEIRFIYNLLKKFPSEMKKRFKLCDTQYDLIEAAKNGQLKIVCWLLDRGTDVHIRDDKALYNASDNGHLEVVRLLLDRGADIHAKNDEALRIASVRGQLEVVRLLLDRGADIHVCNALYWASKNGHLEVVRLLLDRGADSCGDNFEVIQIASRYGRRKIIRLLIENAAKKFKT